MFSLRQVEALYWIGKLGTFERAAARLHTTQSAISKRVQELELIVGLPLFDRTRRSARLTLEGNQLFGLAEDMLGLQQRILNLKDGHEVTARQLRLGITELTALTWLPRLIADLRERWPQIVIETEVGMSRDLYDGLQEDRLDLIVIPDVFTDTHITTVQLALNRNAWMGSPHLVRSRRRLSLEELTAFPILVQGARSGSGLWVSKWLKSEGVLVPRLISCDSLVALLGLAVAGVGVTYLPRECFQPLVTDGKLKIIPTRPDLPAIPYSAMYRHDRPSDFMRNVAERARIACDFTRQLQG